MQLVVFYDAASVVTVTKLPEFSRYVDQSRDERCHHDDRSEMMNDFSAAVVFVVSRLFRGSTHRDQMPVAWMAVTVLVDHRILLVATCGYCDGRTYKAFVPA